jgi:hypothetical protein
MATARSLRGRGAPQLTEPETSSDGLSGGGGDNGHGSPATQAVAQPPVAVAGLGFRV